MGRLGLRFVALGYLVVILVGPLFMMVWRTTEDLDGAWAAITAPDTLSAFKLTLLVTVIAVAVNTVFGIVCALVIVRGNIPGRGFLNAFIDLPLALSPVIVGLALGNIDEERALDPDVVIPRRRWPRSMAELRPFLARGRWQEEPLPVQDIHTNETPSLTPSPSNPDPHRFVTPWSPPGDRRALRLYHRLRDD